VAPAAAVADQIEQYVIFVEKPHKRAALSRVLADPRVRSAIVFVRTKHAADRLGASLRAAGVGNGVLHGDKLQPERERALSDFTRGFTRVLVATDVAARGIDIERVSHVINLDIPAVAESYVHRIGRTARAGESGVAISLCASEERAFLAAIERLTGQPLTPLR
jgi:ATP-dependent RNA helicase RhlE